MRLGSTTTYRRPKYCQSSGLFRANRLRVKQRPFRRPEGSWQPFFGISRVSSSSTAGGREDHGAVLQGFIDAIRYSIEGEPSLMAAEKVFLHHDNASAHSPCIVVFKLNQFRYELVSHFLYSLNLAPSDYFLFLILRKSLERKRFSSEDFLQTLKHSTFPRFEETGA